MADGRDGAADEVLVVRDGRVVAVGDAGLEREHPDAELVDLGGRTVAPGFIDAHHHMSLAALHPRWASVRDARDVATIQQRLRTVAGREPDAAWVRGCDWDEPGGGPMLTRHDLDELGFDRPVIVGCFSYHRAVVCSRGLDVLGISAATPDPVNGRIERDERGEPTGVLTEAAWTAAHTASMAGYDDPDQWADLIERYATGLLPHGITAIHDAACPVAAERVYGSLARAGRLPVSVLVMPHGPILSGPDPSRWDGAPTGEGSEQLRVGAVKFFADGGIEVAIDAHLDGHPVHTGAPFEGLSEGMTTAVERGFAVAVHAMGNTGLTHALDAWHDAQRRAGEAVRPVRVEHVTLAGPDHVRRLVELGATGVIQPAFVDLIGRTIGNLRFDEATWLPFADLVGSGLALAASSDGPCHFVDPLRASSCAATRITENGIEAGPDQAVPIRDWLRLYTAGAADAGGQSGERGRLLPGLRADLAILDGDVDGTDALTVSETWVLGQRVWSAA